MPSSVRRVALVCIDPWRWVDSPGFQPFSYAIRRIQAAIVGHPDLGSVEVEVIESTSLDVDELMARIDAFDPDVVGVSAYVWSFPVLLEMCRRVKQERPDPMIIFGGPSARPEMFELPQHRDGGAFVDAICVGEGENVIQEILLAPDRTPATLRKIAGLALFEGGVWTHTPERKLGPPDVHPSPYQLGLMPAKRLVAEIESFRGCPLSCTYCEWGDTGVTPRMFGYDYLVRELQALKKVKADGIWLIDPGLNLYDRAFRNLQRAEAEVGTLKALGNFRCEVYPSHLTDEHLRFLESTRAFYAGIGLQSFDAEVLKGVERPFSEDKFNRVVAEVASIVPDTVVEIIMGLPGDNPENFKRTVEKVRKLPVHVRIFHCLVLPSALMKRAPAHFDLKFDPFTLKVISCFGWSADDIEKTTAWLDDFARSERSDVPTGHGGTWKLARPGKAPALREGASVHEISSHQNGASKPAPKAAPDAFIAAVRRGVDAATAWKLTNAVLVGEDFRAGVVLSLDRGTSALSLRITRKRDAEPYYREANGISYVYESRNADVSADDLKILDGVIARIHPIVGPAILGLRGGQARARGSLPVIGR